MDDSVCGGQSYVDSIVVNYNNTNAPATPTLLLPLNSSTAIKDTPEFRLGTTDPESEGVRYVIQVCSTSNCSALVRTIDQTISQLGWQSQSMYDAAAYATDPSTIIQYAIHQYQQPVLSASTQYWWRAKAIDIGGRESSYSSIWSFTTGTATSSQPTVDIKGNVNIGGGVIIKP